MVELILAAVGLFIAIAIFLAIRSLVLWYFNLDKLDKLIDQNEKIIGILEYIASNQTPAPPVNQAQYSQVYTEEYRR